VAISVVQSSALKRVASDSTDFSENAASNFTAGNSVFITVSHYAATATITGVTINGTAATKEVGLSNGDSTAELWRVFSVTGGGSGVTITYSGGADNALSFNILETTKVALDTGTQNSASSTGNTPAVSTAATTSVSETIVIAMVADATVTAPTFGGPTGWTNLWGENDGTAWACGRAAYSIESTTGTKTATFTANNTPQWAAVIAAYKDDTGGGGGGGGTTIAWLTA
jgi:hypothetical protein